MLSYCFSLYDFCVIVGGRRDEGVVQVDRSWYCTNIVHVPEVERGPLGSCSGGRGPGVAGGGAADGFGRCCECAVARVRPLRFTNIVILISRRLNAHLSSIVSSKPFQMPVDVAPRTTAVSGSRLSSFGFSGTIAHAAFEARKTVVTMSNDSKSLYRNRRFLTPIDTTRLDWMIEAPGPQQSRLEEAVTFSGALSSSAEALFSHHVVGGTIILPGVGYVEMAFAASSGLALTAVAFLRPCVLSGPGRGEKCVLRCTQCGATLEIASRSLNAK